MLHKIGTEFLKRRILMWMSGQVRPEAPVLIPFVRVGLLGLAASIAGGLLFTLGCMGLLAALYMYVSSLGLTPAVALLAVSGVTFMLAIAIFFTVQALFKRRINAINSTLQSAPPVQIDDAMIEVPRAIIAGFLQGVLGERDTHTPHN